MEIRIIIDPDEYEAMEIVTQELRRLLSVHYERDLSRQKGPGVRRYIRAKAKKSSRSSPQD